MHGPLFERWLGLKPWDLERMTLAQVRLRLAWIKHRLASREVELDD